MTCPGQEDGSDLSGFADRRARGGALFVWPQHPGFSLSFNMWYTYALHFTGEEMGSEESMTSTA